MRNYKMGDEEEDSIIGIQEVCTMEIFYYRRTQAHRPLSSLLPAIACELGSVPYTL
jgi:hypothetical protein